MTPLAKQPEFAEASAELDELNAAKAKVQARITEIEMILNSPFHDSDDSHVAAALEFASSGVVKGPTNVPSDLHEEHLVLRQQRDSLSKAVAARYQARDRLAQELSVKVCAKLSTRHREMAARALAALLEFDALQEAERQFFREIEGAGYDARFPDFISWPAIGTCSMQSESMLFHKVRELRTYLA